MRSVSPVGDCTSWGLLLGVRKQQGARDVRVRLMVGFMVKLMIKLMVRLMIKSLVKFKNE